MRRVIYLISGPSHMVNLVCSIHTLRKYWNGQIDVLAWEESQKWAGQICEDPRIAADMISWTPLHRGRHATFVDKTRLIQSFPEDDPVLFLDADTTIAGDICPMFDMIEEYGFMVAQWCDWTTAGHMTASRIKSLKDIRGIGKDLVDPLLRKAWPSLNTGVFGAYSDSLALEAWHQFTLIAQNTFIPDEKTSHLLMPIYMPKHQMCVAGDGGRWNCSPKCQPENLANEDVVIWHYHGDSNLRPQKSARSVFMWSKFYEECFVDNVGGLRDWVGEIPNKFLSALRKEGTLQ